MRLSLASRVLPLMIRLSRTQHRLAGPAGAERHLAERTLRPRPFGPPRRLRGDVRITTGRFGSWPVYTITPANGAVTGGLVYVHGGAWVNEIAPQHFRLAAQIAAEAGLAVTVPIYPLVPTGTAAAVVQGITELVLSSTAEHGPTSLAGDSAGGQIALSAALRLRDQHRPLPLTVLIAPALDLALANPEIDDVQPYDPWLTRDGMRLYIDLWRDGLALTDPQVSPLVGDLHGLGPLLVFSGTRDILNPDSRLLNAKAHAAGVPIIFQEGDGLLHVYPLTPAPEGRTARSRIVAELRTAHRRRPGAL